MTHHTLLNEGIFLIVPSEKISKSSEKYAESMHCELLLT